MDYDDEFWDIAEYLLWEDDEWIIKMCTLADSWAWN